MPRRLGRSGMTGGGLARLSWEVNLGGQSWRSILGPPLRHPMCGFRHDRRHRERHDLLVAVMRSYPSDRLHHRGGPSEVTLPTAFIIGVVQAKLPNGTPAC